MPTAQDQRILVSSSRRKSPRKTVSIVDPCRQLIRDYCEMGWLEAALLQLEKLGNWEWPDVWRWSQAIQAIDFSNGAAVIEKIGKDHPVALMRLMRWTAMARLQRWAEVLQESDEHAGKEHVRNVKTIDVAKYPAGYVPTVTNGDLVEARIDDLRAQAMMACGNGQRSKEAIHIYQKSNSFKVADPRARLVAQVPPSPHGEACQLLDEHGDGEGALRITSAKIASMPIHSTPIWDPWLTVHAEALKATRRLSQLHRLARHLVHHHPRRSITWYTVYLLKRDSEEGPRFLLKSLARDETFLPAWIALAHHLTELGDVDHAGASLLHALRHLAPQSPLLLYRLAKHWLSLRQVEIASAYLVEAYGIIKDSLVEGVEVLELIGHLYQQRGELIKAERMYQLAWEREQRKKQLKYDLVERIITVQLEMKDRERLEGSLSLLSLLPRSVKHLKLILNVKSFLNLNLQADLEELVTLHPEARQDERIMELLGINSIDDDAMDIELPQFSGSSLSLRRQIDGLGI